VHFRSLSTKCWLCAQFTTNNKVEHRPVLFHGKKIICTSQCPKFTKIWCYSDLRITPVKLTQILLLINLEIFFPKNPKWHASSFRVNMTYFSFKFDLPSLYLDRVLISVPKVLVYGCAVSLVLRKTQQWKLWQSTIPNWLCEGLPSNIPFSDQLVSFCGNNDFQTVDSLLFPRDSFTYWLTSKLLGFSITTLHCFRISASKRLRSSGVVWYYWVW